MPAKADASRINVVKKKTAVCMLWHVKKNIEGYEQTSALLKESE